MPVLQNYDRNSQGSYTTTNHDGTTTVTSYPSGRSRLYKVGTGPRRMPEIKDETPYQMAIRSYNFPRGRGSLVQNGWLNSKFEGVVPGFAGLFSTRKQGWFEHDLNHDTNFKDIANLKALAKLSQRDMDLGAAWLEREKTAGLLRGVATTAVDALRAIRRRSGRELLNALGLDHSGARGSGFVNAPLAYWYGLTPLINDVNGAVQSLTRLESDDWRVTTTGAHANVKEDSVVLPTGGAYAIRADRTYRQSCRVKISADQRPLTRQQDMLWSLGLDSPLSTMYEVTPYSWMLDWALPIGDWLEALNTFKYYSGWTCTYSQFLQEKHTWTGAPYKDAYVVSSNFSKGSGMHVHVNRTVTGIPLVGLPVKNPASMLHMAKALSLLASKLSGSHGNMVPIIRY